MTNVLLASSDVAQNAGFMVSLGGTFLALVGVALACLLPGIGSAKGVMYVGSAAAGLISENPKKFGACLTLEMLPCTQGIYGFVIAFMILNSIPEEALSLSDGAMLLAASLPIALVGFISAICQGKVAAACISVVAKQKSWGNTIVITLAVELFALFGLLISLFMIQ